MNHLNISDAHALVLMGIEFARDGAQSRCMTAAQMWVIARDSEQALVRAEFEEGVRNYSRDMGHYNDCMWEFDDWCEFYRLQS